MVQQRGPQVCVTESWAGLHRVPGLAWPLSVTLQQGPGSLALQFSQRQASHLGGCHSQEPCCLSKACPGLLSGLGWGLGVDGGGVRCQCRYLV